MSSASNWELHVGLTCMVDEAIKMREGSLE
jgi:hypothetical protein